MSFVLKVKLDERFFVSLLFGVLLMIGLLIYDDFGFSIDEPFQRETGYLFYDYVTNGDLSVFDHPDKIYGVVFELPLIYLEQWLGLVNLNDIYYMRHLMNFLVFFAGVFVFYLLIKDWLGDYRFGLLGSLFLLLSPRIFGHAFYNSKDPIFMCFFIFSAYSMINFLRFKNNKWAIIHALTTALLIDSRVVGVLIPFMTFLMFFFDFFVGFKKKYSFYPLFLFSVLLVFFVILFWPYLWVDPVNHFITAIIEFSNYVDWKGSLIYFGQEYTPYLEGLPWHYIPVWLLMTTPVVFTILFFVGVYFLFKDLFVKGSLVYNMDNRFSIALFCCFILPVLAVIFLNPVLYNGWRHLFFIYPFFLCFSVKGFVGLFDSRKQLVVFLTIIGLLYPFFFMVYYHPFQALYFNSLIDVEWAASNFEFDYWDVTKHAGLEYIMANDDRDYLLLAIPHLWAFLLPPEDYNRILFVNAFNVSDYLFSDTAQNLTNCADEFFSIDVRGAKALVICKQDRADFPV